MYIDDTARLKHMLGTAQKAHEFIRDRNRNELDKDEMFLFALVHAIEIIGEAANHISDDFKSKHPEILWNRIVTMRNRLIHGYFKIDLDIVWDTVTNDISILIEQLEKIIEEENIED